MKITIDFGNDFVREYNIHDLVESELNKGSIVAFRFTHPLHGERAEISIAQLAPPCEKENE